MRLNHVESLVQRGVTVLRDGQAVGPRLGSYETKAQASKATPISTRHPSPGCLSGMPGTTGRRHPDANGHGNGAVPWAGRLSRAGVLSRRSPAHSAGGTGLQRWSRFAGGPKFTAAARLCPERAKQAASVADVPYQRPSDLRDSQATRTLTAASTRGRGFSI
jgi:hypothetical protein